MRQAKPVLYTLIRGHPSLDEEKEIPAFENWGKTEI